VHEFSYSVTALISAEAALCLATTTDSGFAADITPRCCRDAYATSVAIVDKGATIIAPVIVKPIASLAGGADTTTYPGYPCVVELGGQIILAAGRAVVTDTTVAVGAVMQFGYLWEEVDA
jgi:hypothetical protein